jgi:hypothetical protein
VPRPVQRWLEKTRGRARRLAPPLAAAFIVGAVLVGLPAG